jgi:hypothetical protein
VAVAAIRPDDDACCPRCSRLAALLRIYGDQLALRDWEFQVAHGEPTREGAMAEIEMASGRRIARVRVSLAWEDLERDEQRHALAHELVHPHARDFVESVLAAAHQEFGGAAYRMFAATVERELERMVDALAVAVGPVLPLP